MASNAAPFVQRGFNLPNYGIDPSMLTGIPEQSQQQPPSLSDTGGSMSPGSFAISQFRSWNSPGSSDDLTEALQSFINLDGDAHLSSSNTANANISPQLSGSIPLPPTSRGSLHDFHGYKVPSSQQQEHSPERPSFLRDNSSTAGYVAVPQQHHPHLQQRPNSASSGSSNVPKSPSGLNIVHGDCVVGRSFTNTFSPASFSAGLPSPSLVDTPIEEEAGSASSRRSTSRPRRTASPHDEQGRGRTASTGKAPVQRPSRSRTRRPSYSRTISPGQNPFRNSTSSSPGTSGHHASSNSLSGISIPVPSSATNSAASAIPYVPGYPLPNSSVSSQRYGASVPTYMNGSSGSAAWPSPIQQQQSPALSNSLSFASIQHQQHQRRLSEASAFAPSSFGTTDFSPSFRSIPLPEMDVPHQPSPKSANGMASIPSSAPAGYSFAVSASPNEELQDIKEEESNAKSGKNPDDKRKKRRESHNAVERKRRDNINERITDLARLIPEVLLDSATAGVSRASLDDKEPSPTGTSSKQACMNGLSGSPSVPILPTFTPAQLAQQQSSARPNKGIILAKSVEYMFYLQQLVRVQSERNNELEQRVKQLESAGSVGGMYAAFANLQGAAPLQHYQHHDVHNVETGRSGSLPSSSGGSGNGNKSANSSASPHSLLGMSNNQQLPTVEERLMEEHQMTFEDLLGMTNASPAKVEDDEDDAMMGD